jgi:hypothetical protein
LDEQFCAENRRTELSAGSVSGGCWANVRFGSEADIAARLDDVRFADALKLPYTPAEQALNP